MGEVGHVIIDKLTEIFSHVESIVTGALGVLAVLGIRKRRKAK